MKANAMTDSQRIHEIHTKHYGDDAKVFWAPGRVNLIGEHTDYAGGFVMPAAIDFGTLAAVSPAGWAHGDLVRELCGRCELQRGGVAGDAEATLVGLSGGRGLGAAGKGH